MQKLVNEVLLDHHEEGEPEAGSWWQEKRRALYRFVNSTTFEYITSVVIMPLAPLCMPYIFIVFYCYFLIQFPTAECFGLQSLYAGDRDCCN